ncbi:MAG: hypothetical protein AAF743_02145 [Planctomycetota bacterium]
MQLHTHSCHTRPAHRQRGSALVLVLILVAATAVMCWAMLGESGLRAKAAATSSGAMAAAEHNDGGMQLALFYLANPDESDEGTVDGVNGPYWPGGTYTLDGTDVDVTVTPEAGDVFTVDVASTHNGVTRTDRKRVQRSRTFSVDAALQTAGKALLPDEWIVTGGIESPHQVEFHSGTYTYADLVVASNHYQYANSRVQDRTGRNDVVPDADNVAWLTASEYSFNGVVYDIDYRNNDIQNTTLGPTSDNPLGVYRIKNDKKLENVTIKGTLICRGQLDIDKDVTIDAAEGMPALVTKKNLNMTNDSRLGMRGLVYVGGKLEGTSTSAIRVQGALLIADAHTNGLDHLFDGALEVIYDAEASSARDFANDNREETRFEVLE